MLRVALTATCFIALSVGLPGTANAACAAPELVASPTVGRPEATVTLTGRHFASDCFDTGQTNPAPPLTAIQLAFEQAGRSQVLSVVDANVDYAFAADVAIPATAAPGAAVLVAQGSGQNPVRTPFTVAAQRVAGPAPTEQELPLTGPDTATLAALGLALVLVTRRT